MRKIFLTTIILLLATYSNGQIADTITYNQKSKLDWTDFKEIGVVSDSSKGFNFSSSIQMRIVKANVWTGVTTFEAYGIYYSCITLQTLLRDRQFTIKTDHKNLLYIREHPTQ